MVKLMPPHRSRMIHLDNSFRNKVDMVATQVRARPKNQAHREVTLHPPMTTPPTILPINAINIPTTTTLMRNSKLAPKMLVLLSSAQAAPSDQLQTLAIPLLKPAR